MNSQNSVWPDVRSADPKITDIRTVINTANVSLRAQTRVSETAVWGRLDGRGVRRRRPRLLFGQFVHSDELPVPV